METIEKLPPARLASFDDLAGLWIKRDAHETVFARLAFEHQKLNHRLTVIGRRDEPEPSTGRVLGQIVLRKFHRFGIGRDMRLDLRLHPASDFMTEKRQCAGQEHSEQYPAEDQPRPSVQP